MGSKVTPEGTKTKIFEILDPFGSGWTDSQPKRSHGDPKSVKIHVFGPPSEVDFRAISSDWCYDRFGVPRAWDGSHQVRLVELVPLLSISAQTEP